MVEVGRVLLEMESSIHKSIHSHSFSVEFTNKIGMFVFLSQQVMFKQTLCCQRDETAQKYLSGLRSLLLNNTNNFYFV